MSACSQAGKLIVTFVRGQFSPVARFCEGLGIAHKAYQDFAESSTTLCHLQYSLQKTPISIPSAPTNALGACIAATVPQLELIFKL
jgi:hypothetical protein